MFKNTCLAIIVSCLLFSCYAYKAPAIKIGMSLEEFKGVAKYEQLVAMDKEYTVYKVVYGYEWERTGYYYFKNDKLEKMDSQEYRSQVIKINKGK